jgi:hypothetical protein
MPLSWNEIKSRAAVFSKKWENESSEDAEAKSFWDDLLHYWCFPDLYVMAAPTIFICVS